MTYRRFRQTMMTLAMVMAVFFISACNYSGGAATTVTKELPMETPLWVGPYDIFINPERNLGFPDTGAVYWSAYCTIPEGAKLELACKYAHARYISINSYDAAQGAPTDALTDARILPDEGSENPFLPGAKRTIKNRNFTITILNELPPPRSGTAQAQHFVRKGC